MNPIGALPRAERRRLVKQADLLVSSFRGRAVDPGDLVFLAPNAPNGLVVPAANRAAFLARLGLDDLEVTIASTCPRAVGFVAPVLVVIRDWARLSFLDAHPFVRGGAA